jgi:hypothetical protein
MMRGLGRAQLAGWLLLAAAALCWLAAMPHGF